MLKQRGDTIVEVLIAISIASAVLAGAYAIASISSKSVRSSQERTEALKLAAGAVEAIKASPKILSTDSSFCGDTALTPLTTPSLPVLGSPADIDGTGYNSIPASACKSTNVGPTYYTAVEFDYTKKVYTVHTRWDRVGGGSRQEVTLVYKKGVLD